MRRRQSMPGNQPRERLVFLVYILVFFRFAFFACHRPHVFSF